MSAWFNYVIGAMRGLLMSRAALTKENIALRSQLALFEHQVLSGKRPKPRITPAFRQLWVILSRCWADWKSVLVVVRPETVIKWHRTAFCWYWRWKSGPKGRPPVSPATIAPIKRIHNDNPMWSPERIHHQLLSLGLSDVPCPNTIARYIPTIRKPPSEKVRQSWRTFLSNHMHNTWAMDFATVPSITFRVLYVLVIVNHERREIKHIAVTTRPTADWTVQHLREATPFAEQPKYLIHDNDPVFRSSDVQHFLISTGIESVRTGYRQPQQHPLVDYAKLVMDTARSVNPRIRFMMREHALPVFIAMYQLQYKDDPTVGSKETTRRLGKDMEAIIARQTTPPGADFQSWFFQDSTFLGHGIPLYFLFHYYEAGGPGVLAPISPVMSHLSWALPLYLRELNKYLEPGQGLIGCTSPVDGVEVALWHPEMDAQKYMRNRYRAKYGFDAGDDVYEALKDTDRITSAFILEYGRRSESYQMYRWGDFDKPLAIDMQPVIKAGFGGSPEHWMQPRIRQPQELKSVRRGDLQKLIARFELKEETAIAERAEQKTAAAFAVEPSNEELQRIHAVAVGTNHLVGLFKDYHQALIYANAAKNEKSSGNGATDDLVALSRKHLTDAIFHLQGYVDSYREIADKSKSFPRLAGDIKNAYLYGIIAVTREACYLFDKDFGGDSTLLLLDERLRLQ